MEGDKKREDTRGCDGKVYPDTKYQYQYEGGYLRRYGYVGGDEAGNMTQVLWQGLSLLLCFSLLSLSGLGQFMTSCSVPSSREGGLVNSL